MRVWKTSRGWLGTHVRAEEHFDRGLFRKTGVGDIPEMSWISSDGLAWRFQMPGWVAGKAEPHLDVAGGIFSEWRQFYHWALCEGL